MTEKLFVPRWPRRAGNKFLLSWPEQMTALFRCLVSVLLICGNLSFCLAATDQDNSKNTQTALSLLDWIQTNLNSKSAISAEDLANFFASSFTFDTNGKIIHATPLTYLNYLNKFKQHILSIRYEIEPLVNDKNSVVIPCIVNIQYIHFNAGQHYRVIIILKFNEHGKIIEWQEVFTKK